MAKHLTRQSISSLRAVSAIVLLLACSSSLAQAPDALATLRRLVDAGGYEQAYQLGREHNDWKGNPHFDFLFGVAAINSSHIPEGLLALERHLAAVPANDRARLELAKGYFELGDFGRSRQEFEFVLRYNPPEEVRANIQRYLDGMRTRDSAALRATSRAYLEAGLGYDSNVNSGTYITQIPFFNGIVDIVPGSSALAVGAAYWQARGGGQIMRRVSPSLAVFAGGDLEFKRQPAAAAFDTTNAGGYLGFSVLRGATLYRLSLADSVLFVDDDKYRNTLSLTGEAQYSLGNDYTLHGVAQYAELGHADDNAIRDSKLTTLGIGARKTLQTAWRPGLGLQFAYSREDNLEKSDDLSRGQYAIRLTLSASPVDRLGVNAGVGWQRGRYNALDYPFGSTREDTMWQADLGANYALTPHWTLRAEYQWTDNRSNQALYSFKRELFGFKTQYTF